MNHIIMNKEKTEAIRFLKFKTKFNPFKYPFEVRRGKAWVNIDFVGCKRILSPLRCSHKCWWEWEIEAFGTQWQFKSLFHSSFKYYITYLLTASLISDHDTNTHYVTLHTLFDSYFSRYKLVNFPQSYWCEIVILW